VYSGEQTLSKTSELTSQVAGCYLLHCCDCDWEPSA